MQEAVLPAPQAPATPVAPVPALPTPAVAPGSAIGLPLSRAEIRALLARRDELSRQLTSASGRRNDLASQLQRRPDIADRAGIESRISFLDKRILQLESDLSQTGQLLASAGPDLNTSTTVPPPIPRGKLSSDQITGITVVFMLAVMAPIALAVARSIWRRASRQSAAPPPNDYADRFDRLEQAVDAIAIEIERVSEGQRFVTRALAEGSPAAIGAGSAAELPLRDRDAVAVRRDGA